MPGDEEKVDRRTYNEINAGVEGEGGPTAPRLEEQMRKRPEHRARESAEERHRGDGAAVARARVLRERRKSRIVEAPGHRGPPDQPAGHHDRRGGRPPPQPPGRRPPAAAP